MASKEVIETSEAEIAVHWGEEEYYHPSIEFIAQANMTDPGIYERFSLDNFPNCFKEYADLLDFVITSYSIHYTKLYDRGSVAATGTQSWGLASAMTASQSRSRPSTMAAVSMGRCLMMQALGLDCAISMALSSSGL